MQNNIKIVGQVKEILKPFTIDNGDVYRQYIVVVPRTSENTDSVKLVVPAKTNNEFNINDIIFVNGKVKTRTYHNIKENKAKLDVYVEGEAELTDEVGSINSFVIDGYICKKPIFRTTPKGKEVCDIFIANNEEELRRSYYIPCICFGKCGRMAREYKVGDLIRISGRFQSRLYHKVSDPEDVNRVAYELAVSHLDKLNNTNETK